MTTPPSGLPLLTPGAIAERCHQTDPGLEQLWATIVSFASAIQTAGGQAYLVGGAVRDLLWSKTPTDFDIEVHRLGPEEVERLAGTFGKISSVGRSFGIIKIHRDGHDVDISLPRQETKVGAGHRDFSIGIDPNMGIPAAAQRRDFTLGAIYLDILSGVITDPFDGVTAVREHQLRMVNAQSFIEDPLRLLRAMQLAARFDLTVEPDTLTALQNIVPMMGSLSVERVRQEWEKILLAPQPSIGLRLGQATGYIEQWHPEISALWATPQDPQQHPEGNVWNHTLAAIDQLPALVQQLQLASALPVALAVLVHDFGKPVMTRNVEGVFRADRHEVAAAEPVDAFLQRIGFEEKIRAKVLALVRAHHWMDRVFIAAQRGVQPTNGEIRRLVEQINPANLFELLAVTAADIQGRGPFARPDGLVAMPEIYAGLAWWVKKIANDHLDQPLEPILWGRDLVERRWPMGPAVGEAVRLAEQLGFQGVSREEILQIVDTVQTPDEAIATLRTLVQNEASDIHQPAARSST